MIEVEKKFQPTEAQLQALLQDAVFIKEKTMHDVYYDFSDFRIMRAGNRLRKRDDGFELKAYIPTESGVRVAHEYTDDESILKNLQINESYTSVADLVQKEMHPVCDFVNTRKEYKKDEFIVDVDSMNFGMEVVEIELQVESKDQIPEAEQKILQLAESFGMEVKDLQGKTILYLQKMKPEIYQEIFGNKNKE